MRAQQTATDGDGHADGWCLLPKATWGGWGRGEGDVGGAHVVGVGRRRYSGPCGVARSQLWPVGVVRAALGVAQTWRPCALCNLQKFRFICQISEQNSVPKESGSSENSSVENQREQKNVKVSQNRRPAKLSINVYFSDEKHAFVLRLR